MVEELKCFRERFLSSKTPKESENSGSNGNRSNPSPKSSAFGQILKISTPDIKKSPISNKKKECKPFFKFFYKSRFSALLISRARKTLHFRAR